MKLTEKFGYGPNCYVIDFGRWGEMRQWLCENGVGWWQVSSGPEGIGFQIKSQIEWFNLKWI